MKLQARAKDLLFAWRGEHYSFGPGCLEDTGAHVAALGGPVLVIAGEGRWLRQYRERLLASVSAAGVTVCGDGPVLGAGPNAPEADVLRLADELAKHRPTTIAALGGGSTIDAVKAAMALAVLDGRSELLAELFGTGQVTARLAGQRVSLPGLVAVQTAASSAAHLTKYSNVTLDGTYQKKLIVDTALVPPRAVFDYDLTHSATAGLTADGAFDGMAHCLEVLWGAASPSADPGWATAVTDVSLCGLELLIKYLPTALGASENQEARVALGLGTDLGGYAIMLGGTSGPHLNSFSLVEAASHGRACAVLNPYWTAFFAPAIEPQLRAVAEIYRRYGYLDRETDDLSPRALGLIVARAMMRFAASLGYPTTLAELPDFRERHIAQALAAARDPQLSMKLRNMPIPLVVAEVDRYMEPLLRAAASGDLSLIKEYGE